MKEINEMMELKIKSLKEKIDELEEKKEDIEVEIIGFKKELRRCQIKMEKIN